MVSENLTDQLIVRPASVSELMQLVEIERAAQQHPWSIGHLAQSLQDDFVVVAQRGTELIAYCALQIVLDEVSLLNVAVKPQLRRQGIARQLLDSAFEQVRARGCTRCFLEVRAGNAGAIALYNELGFVFDGIRRDYYPTDTGREDARLLHIDW